MQLHIVYRLVAADYHQAFLSVLTRLLTLVLGKSPDKIKYTNVLTMFEALNRIEFSNIYS